jgi:hypothetical protein
MADGERHRRRNTDSIRVVFARSLFRGPHGTFDRAAVAGIV